jgi:hypothetical protein
VMGWKCRENAFFWRGTKDAATAPRIPATRTEINTSGLLMNHPPDGLGHRGLCGR